MSRTTTLNDDVHEDEEFEYVDDEERNGRPAPSISNIGWTAPNGKSRLFCFHCNRPESHFNGLKGRWYFWIVNGMTFGLIRFIGPYRCRCCGNKRYLSFNKYHPKYIYQNMQAKKANRRDKRRY